MTKIRFLFFITTILLSINSTAQCFWPGVWFSTQESIDNFKINYAWCTEIDGDVRIKGTDITNLNGLSHLEKIHGYIEIIDNPVLINLKGLDSLYYIKDNINIENNQSLKSLEGLGKIEELNGWIAIGNNDSLIDLAGLSNLRSVISLGIGPNKLIEDLTGLENLKTIGQLKSLNGNLKSFSGLISLDTVIGSIYLYQADSLKNLHGLENLRAATGSLYIENNASLLQLTGLNNLKSVGYRMDIQKNEKLQNLTGLESLQFIGRDLFVDYNPKLENITALMNLNFVGETIGIRNNPMLTGLLGIDSINSDSLDHLAIRNNSSLSVCDVKSVCDFLKNANSFTIIEYNASGCNDRGEVEEACYSSVDEGIEFTSLKNHPNPFFYSTTIEYSLFSPSHVNLSIYNQFGELVHHVQVSQQHGKQAIKWDAVGLPSGVYFYRLEAGKQKANGKLLLSR